MDSTKKNQIKYEFEENKKCFRFSNPKDMHKVK